MVLRAGFKKKMRLYVELKIYDKNRRKITGPQCVKECEEGGLGGYSPRYKLIVVQWRCC
jgi:hypothetical protein